MNHPSPLLVDPKRLCSCGARLVALSVNADDGRTLHPSEQRFVCPMVLLALPGVGSQPHFWPEPGLGQQSVEPGPQPPAQRPTFRDGAIVRPKQARAPLRRDGSYRVLATEFAPGGGELIALDGWPGRRWVASDFEQVVFRHDLGQLQQPHQFARYGDSVQCSRCGGLEGDGLHRDPSAPKARSVTPLDVAEKVAAMAPPEPEHIADRLRWWADYVVPGQSGTQEILREAAEEIDRLQRTATAEKAVDSALAAERERRLLPYPTADGHNFLRLYTHSEVVDALTAALHSTMVERVLEKLLAL